MDVRVEERVPITAAAVRGEVTYADLPDYFGRAFTEVYAAVEAAGATVTGPPFGFYPGPPTETTVVVEAGFPTSRPLDAIGDVHPIELPGGSAVVTVHIGPYDTLAQTYAALTEWMTEAGLRPAPGMWENYLSDPSLEPDPTTWRTEIVWPVDLVS